MAPTDLIDHWRDLGAHRAVGDDEVFVVDLSGPDTRPPLLYLHGFPTSSIDLAPVAPRLAEGRRVVALDLPGYGLSSKPDRPYSLFAQADVVLAVLVDLGVGEIDLLSHDMGDSVAGEFLARSMLGAHQVTVRRRVLTNGSIYMDLVQLTDGQQLLLSLPDEAAPAEIAPDAETMATALLATLAPGSEPTEDLRAAAELVVADGGGRLLARLIRYIEERRRYEWRWTGALERHRAPLAVLWGAEDPIAVVGMAHRMAERRPDADLVVLDGVGHYPMLEAPERFADAVAEFLD
ncbi:MAG: alpha/beta hydrolase [Acidimicrobiia bacterium]|nr:alpha/beta hydrolase [Acidimicrobiia bacterium]